MVWHARCMYGLRRCGGISHQRTPWFQVPYAGTHVAQVHGGFEFWIAHKGERARSFILHGRREYAAPAEESICVCAVSPCPRNTCDACQHHPNKKRKPYCSRTEIVIWMHHQTIEVVCCSAILLLFYWLSACVIDRFAAAYAYKYRITLVHIEGQCSLTLISTKY